jgi:hypothetical protein
MASVDGVNLKVRFKLIHITTANSNNYNVYCECRGRENV